MDDFIFGTLASDEARLARLRQRRAGITHQHARLPRDPQPDQPVRLSLTVGPTHACDDAWVYWTNDGSDPQGERGRAAQGYATRMEPVGVEWDTLLWGYVRRFQATLPAQPADTVVRYRLSACARGAEIFADEDTHYAYYIADDPPPAWAHDAIIYHIFVDRFYPGDGLDWQQPASKLGFYGGTLRGITDKLDYISALGANTLWLSPIFPSPSHHGYDATNLFDIEPRLGTKADLRALLDAAHARDVRVLLDFVPNHWSHEHPHFQEALRNAHSPNREWYTFGPYATQYKTFFGVQSLPQVNLRFAAARQHMLEAAAYWLDFGVDGYRLDYAIGPTPDFWADFRRVTRAVRPDCWMFGEVVEPPDAQLAFEGLLDGCLDFTLMEALRETFAFGRWNASRLLSFLERHQAYFPASFARPSFLDNHDMNRFLWAAGNETKRLRLAALCQFTLAGAPIIYYGTEIGQSQEADVRQHGRVIHAEARLPMAWARVPDNPVLDFYRQLIALRRQEPALRRGEWRALHVDADTLAYARVHEGDVLPVVLNLAASARQVMLTSNWITPVFATDSPCAMTVEDGRVTLHLPPLGGVVLKSGASAGER